MAPDAEQPDIDNELELTDEAQDQASEEGTDQQDSDEEAEEEDVLTFGDGLDPDPEGETGLVKKLREEVRRRDKELSEFRKANAPKPIEVGEKPTLAGFDYDEEKYEAALDSWKERKAAAERQSNDSQQAQQRDAEAWQSELKRYTDGKATLGYADVDDAEATVTAVLNQVQQAVLIKAADNPAKVLYALAKHPDRLTSLASISDPLKLAAAVARLEGQLKVVKKRKAPEPDRPERGSGAVGKGVDKHLEKLEREAEKSNDRTAVVAYKRKLKMGK